MRLLDLFCGAGGAAMGYHRAGFDVVGVDIEPQPHYPFEFHQWTARAYLCTSSATSARFDAIHAARPARRSPPIAGEATGSEPPHPTYRADTRDLLEATGLPLRDRERRRRTTLNPAIICGSSLGLDVRRHRLFETNWPLLTPPCAHGWQTPRFQQATNRTTQRSTVEVGVWRIPLETQQAAMGIDWMTLEELSEAIPPAYTEHIGHQLAAILEREAVA